MQRSIDQLVDLVSDINLAQDLQYQKLIEAKRALEEADLPQGVWASDEKLMGWDEIELKTWNILTVDSRDYKLIGLWAQAYINTHGFHGINTMLQIVMKSLQTNKQFVQGDNEHKMAIIRYLDKNIAPFLALVNINLGSHNRIPLSRLENFSLENYMQFQDVLAYITDELALKLQSLCDDLNGTMQALREYLQTHSCDNLVKAVQLIELVPSFLAYRAQVQAREHDSANAASQQEEQNDLQNLAYYRQVAYASIHEGLQVLERVDPQNIIVPFLHKALQWKDMSMLEIFEDIGTAAQIEAFIKILKDSGNAKNSHQSQRGNLLEDF